MAYVVGFLCADGNIVKTKRGNHYVALYSADRSLLVSIKKALRSDHVVSMRAATSGNVFRIQVGSRGWFEDLAAIGLNPNKALRMRLPSVPKECFGDFVRGYFDGDGNVWVGLVHKDRKTALKTIQVSFTSASIEFLRELHTALKEQGVQKGGLYIPHHAHFGRLTFSVHDTLKIYRIMYNTPHKLFLKRKKIVFEQFVETWK